MNQFLSERFIVISVCFSFLIVSHCAIPQFNEGKDFFIFSSWQLFSSGPKEKILDISWNNGQTFLYRNHREEAKNVGINIHTLFYLLESQNVARIKRDYCNLLKMLSDNNSLKVYELRSSLADHIFFKKTHQMIRTIEICSD